MEFPISQPKVARLPRNKKETYRLNSRAQMCPSGLTLAMTLTLNFQGQIWNFLYLSQKGSDCHETKSKHIDWNPGLKCDQWVSTWPLNFEGLMGPWALTTHMTLTMDFHGQILKYLYLRMGGPIDIAQRRWQWVNHDHLVNKVRCMDLPDSDWGDFSCRRAVDSSS